MMLFDGNEGIEYEVESINVGDDDIKQFLFSLGCYSGEKVTIVSKKKRGIVLSIKDSRYSIDSELARVIEVKSA